jgi:putative addiction module antidote
MHTTTIRRIGNSLGVILPKSVLQRSGLTAGSEVLVSTDAYRIVLSNAEPDEESFDDLVEEILDEHGPLFEALANR